MGTLSPVRRLFIDGRFEARQVQVWEDYLSISRGRADWQKTLDSYNVRTLVLNKEFHEGLIPFVEAIWQNGSKYTRTSRVLCSRRDKRRGPRG